MRLDALLDRVGDLDVSLSPRAAGADRGDDRSSTTPRRSAPGALFCCVPGAHVDGHDLAADAVAAGAAALLVERPLDLGGARAAASPSVRAAMGPVAAAFRGHPSPPAARASASPARTARPPRPTSSARSSRPHGRPTAVIGTLSGPRTTPEAPELQALLADERDAGREAVAMEVSSHALALSRVDGTRFAVAVFTNLSHDHLDFHRDLDDYFEAKARLFTPAYADAAVVNLDDPRGRVLAGPRRPSPPRATRWPTPTTSRSARRRSRFTWRGVDDRAAARRSLQRQQRPRRGHGRRRARHRPRDDRRRPGRRHRRCPAASSRSTPGQPFAVLVDYAHKPDGLASALGAAREAAAAGRVIARVRRRRRPRREQAPEMGEVAARLADRVLLTSDNPRGEDPWPSSRPSVPAWRDTDAAHRRARPGRRHRPAPSARPGPATSSSSPARATRPRRSSATEHARLRRPAWPSREALRRRREGRRVVALLLAAGLAVAVVARRHALLIDWLIARQIGQPIHEDVPEGHTVKAGTPTMGGRRHRRRRRRRLPRRPRAQRPRFTRTGCS